MTPSHASETDSRKQQLPLLVGIGSAQGDDQIGWIVAELVRKCGGDVVQVRVTSVPLDLLNWISGSAELHIVDACDGNESSGHLYRWDWHENDDYRKEESSTAAPGSSSGFLLRGTGTHDFDVVSVLELARRLGQLPQSVTIWGIQGERWTGSETLSPSVAGVLPDVSELIAKELVDARTITGKLTVDAG